MDRNSHIDHTFNLIYPSMGRYDFCRFLHNLLHYIFLISSRVPGDQTSLADFYGTKISVFKKLCCGIMDITHKSPKSSVLSVHKMQDKAFRQALKSWHIDHLLWYHGSSLTFVRGTLTDRFFTEERSIPSTRLAWSRWSASISYVHGGSLLGLSGLVSDLSGRYVHEIAHDHVHVQTGQVSFCACPCAHMHKVDLLIAPNKRHVCYLMDVISSTPIRRDSSVELLSTAADRPKFLCTLYKTIGVMCIIPQHKKLSFFGDSLTAPSSPEK
jgi:hypothetical protein